MCNRLIIAVFLAVLIACTPEQESGPGEIRWDRETCVRCNMAVGDRHYAAQIRGAAPGEKTGLYKFDDIGCAVIWLQKQAWKDDPRTEIWVADYRSGLWLDARKASYVQDKITPMNYGLGAMESEAATVGDGVMDYAQAIAHILNSEKLKHQHGGHMPMSK